MTEIPEDIMKAARRLLDEALYGGDGLNSIAAALLAERERCAETLRKLYFSRNGEEIAEAIMKGGEA